MGDGWLAMKEQVPDEALMAPVCFGFWRTPRPLSSNLTSSATISPRYQPSTLHLKMRPLLRVNDHTQRNTNPPDHPGCSVQSRWPAPDPVVVESACEPVPNCQLSQTHLDDLLRRRCCRRHEMHIYISMPEHLRCEISCPPCLALDLNRHHEFVL